MFEKLSYWPNLGTSLILSLMDITHTNSLTDYTKALLSFSVTRHWCNQYDQFNALN